MRNDKLFIQSKYDSMAYRYSEFAIESGWKSDHIIEDFVKLSDFKSGSVLDLGCADGYSSQYFLKKEEYKVTGLDLSPESIEKAKLHPFISLLVHDLDKPLPFEDHKFDLIIAYGVLEFIDNLEQIFKEVSRVIKPSGFFTFTIDELNFESKVQNKKTQVLYENKWIAKRYTHFEIENCLELSQFKILKSLRNFAYHSPHFEDPIYYRFYLSQKYDISI